MTDAEEARKRQREKEAYWRFIDKRIPELHNQGKPPPTYDEHGKIVPGRVGDFPGAKAREQADKEWAEMKAQGKVPG